MFKKCTNYPFQKIDGKTLIINTKTNRVHELNKSATFIWEKLDTLNLEDQLVSEVERYFQIEHKLAHEAVSSTLDTLQKEELIQWV